jgi:hypothetical protein
MPVNTQLTQRLTVGDTPGCLDDLVEIAAPSVGDLLLFMASSFHAR